MILGYIARPYPQATNQVITLEQVATLNLDLIVGGDISPSGLEILLKNYTAMYYWSRTPGQNLWEAISDEPVTVAYIPEVQGEAVGWASDGTGYYTVSEELFALAAHLFFYPRINPSGVVITEIMRNPLVVDDTQGEWFEIYNNSSEDVDLDGWTIRDEGGDFHTITQSLELSPGAFLVLGNNADSATNGGLAVDYQYDNFVLDNSDDEILIISSFGEVVDTVSYDSGATFPDPEGASMALLDANMDNAFGLNWRAATRIYGDGDKGTPGASNSGPIPAVTINEIQYTTDPSGQSPLRGQRVTISGVVSVESFGVGNRLFFVQDAVGMWSGIMVYGAAAEKGDRVTFTGTVEEGGGGSTIVIDLSDFQVVENNVPAMDPIPVTTGEISTGGPNAEAYESVLVRVKGICDNDNLGFREWSINDGTGSTRVYHALVGDFTPVLGNEYEVTGIQFYSDDNFMVFPRDESDITGPLPTSGQLNFPTLIRGGGSSSQVVVGAGDTALSIDSTFSAPDGSLIQTQSIEVPANGTSSIHFEGVDLEFGSLNLSIEPQDGHVIASEVISLAGTPPLGVAPAPLCDKPEYLVVQSSDNRTAGAFSNPSSPTTASCGWSVYDEAGSNVGGGSFDVPPLGQVQFFPDERVNLPEDFLGSFKGDCTEPVHVFSLFLRISDSSLASNAVGCGE
ncbi:lamin tail domain-containing protein [Acidobacteria bacterium AH-259-O06]|nr:lamin tail domain-containing protein [Acidobacteria bacterium AH-259-O06]